MSSKNWKNKQKQQQNTTKPTEKRTTTKNAKCLNKKVDLVLISLKLKKGTHRDTVSQKKMSS